MKSKLFKIILKTVTVIIMLFTISLTACSRDGGTESADPSEGTDNSSEDAEDDNDDSSAGDLSTENIDGIEATIGSDDVQYSESKTTSVIKILEKASTNPNDIYDEADYGISISVSNDSDSDDSEQLAFTMSINEYVDFKVGTVYEYNSDNYDEWSAHLSYCPSNCDNESSWEDYTEKTVYLIFSKVPTSVGEEVSGKLEFIVDENASVKSEFSADAESYTISYL